MDIDITNDSLGTDEQGNPVYLKDIWPTEAEIDEIVASAIGAEMFTDSYADVFAGDQQWQSLPTPGGRDLRVGPGLDLRPQAPVLRRDAGRSGAGHRHRRRPGAAQARRLDHHRPHLAGRLDQGRRARPGKYLTEHGVERKDFNSYGSRRGNHEVMIRGTFANIRLRNQLAPGTEGGFTRDFTADGRAGRPRSTRPRRPTSRPASRWSILAGKEYGSGSSRDWAAKGTALLGVKAVIAESYERIHRSNLIGMGVLPLQYPEGQNAESLGLTGEETFEITGVTELNDGHDAEDGQGHRR